MAERFSGQDWTKVLSELSAEPQKYGMPEGGRERSLVLGSLNFRKLSTRRNRKEEIDFLARFCARCDLVSIQEVQDSLDGLRYLKERAEAHIAGEGQFALAVSDITGEVPGESGMAERLAFLYRHHRIRRLDMASDLTYDRTAVLARIFEHETDLRESMAEHEKEMERFRQRKRKTAPTYSPPFFLTFVRTPYVAAFEAPAANDETPLRFTAVNAHLVFGKMAERELEFGALLDWIIARLKAGERLVAPNFILLGDLNLNFDKPKTDRKKIDAQIRASNLRAFGDADERRVYFPFIDQHPVLRKQLRSNARLDETFDQIGFFNAAEEARLPNDKWRSLVSRSDPDGFDYGVFNFTDLFARALRGKPFASLTKAQKDALFAMFEHSVSDHMPIWVRIPRPGFAPPPAP